jgi:hypothetical protein
MILATLGALSGASFSAAQSSLPSAEQYTVRVEYRRWHANLEGAFRQGLLGTTIDPVADLGVPADEKTREIHGALQVAAGHKLRVGYIKLGYAGDTVVDRTLVYSGTVFPINTRVVTSLKGGYWSAGYEFDFLERDTGYLGVVLGGRLLDVDSILVAPDAGIQEAVSTKSVAPTLSLAGRVYASKISLGGEIGGLYLGDRGYLLDADASARLHFSDRAALQVGYRYIKARGELDAEDFLEVKLSGLTYGIEVSF